MRSKKEVITKLKTLQASPENTETLIKTLENLGLIDDEKFIIFFIRDYIEIKKYGLIRVKSELHRKGFEPWLIQDALHSYLEEENYSPIEDAFQLIHQKYNTLAILPDDHKILAFLARRGFDYGTASKALNQFKKK